jgi:hypothetical protein
MTGEKYFPVWGFFGKGEKKTAKKKKMIMDLAQMKILFGPHAKLTKRNWALGRHVYFACLQGEWRAVAANAISGFKMRVDNDTYVLHKSKLTLSDEPVFVLTEASKNLAKIEETTPSSEIHRQALDLSKIFGQTFYLSQSVVENMMPGDHFFSIGVDSMPQRMKFSDFSLDGRKLKWAGKGKTHAKLGKEPVFLLMEIGRRMCKAALTK